MTARLSPFKVTTKWKRRKQQGLNLYERFSNEPKYSKYYVRKNAEVMASLNPLVTEGTEI